MQSGVSYKEFLPLIGTILTLIAGYFFLTIQVRKNRRTKLIEEIRKEISIVLSLLSKLTGQRNSGAMMTVMEEDNLIREVNVHTTTIDLYLNLKLKEHRSFRITMHHSVMIIREGTPNSKDSIAIAEAFQNLQTASKELIDLEIERNESLFR